MSGLSNITTGLPVFAECQLHSAKAGLHSAKTLPSVTLSKEHSAKHLTAKGLCRVPNGKHSAKQTDVIAVAHDEHVRWIGRVPAPRHLAYLYFAECLLFAERRHSVNIDYGVCLWFTECRAPGTRQRGSVPSARGTRQTIWYTA